MSGIKGEEEEQPAKRSDSRMTDKARRIMSTWW